MRNRNRQATLQSTIRHTLHSCVKAVPQAQWAFGATGMRRKAESTSACCCNTIAKDKLEARLPTCAWTSYLEQARNTVEEQHESAHHCRQRVHRVMPHLLPWCDCAIEAALFPSSFARARSARLGQRLWATPGHVVDDSHFDCAIFFLLLYPKARVQQHVDYLFTSTTRRHRRMHREWQAKQSFTCAQHPQAIHAVQRHVLLRQLQQICPTLVLTQSS